MSNGIGLNTARGSGTSGYVERSLASYKPERAARGDLKQPVDENVKKEARLDIDEHTRKRTIALKCVQLREQLEDDDVDDAEIDRQVAQLKEKLLSGDLDSESQPVLNSTYKPRYSERPTRR